MSFVDARLRRSGFARLRVAITTIKEGVVSTRLREAGTWEQGRPTVVHATQPPVAGVSQVVINLVHDQRARGWDVHVACPSQGDLWDRLLGTGTSMHSWDAVRQPGTLTFSEEQRLWAILTRIRPDVVHLHSAKAGLAGRLAVRGRILTLFHPHAWSFEAVTGPMRPALLFWERLAALWTDVTVCVSTSEESLGARVGSLARRRVVVPNGVDLEHVHPREAGQALAKLGLNGGPWVVCVGRVDVQKGQDLLLQAWPAVLAEHPTARLVIVMDGPVAKSLQAIADESVYFAGSSQEVATWLAAANVVALPSRWEGMPLILLEAMASGRAVVGFDVNGVRECLGLLGQVIRRGDVSAFSSGIVAYLDDPTASQETGLRLRRRAEECFALEQAGQGISDAVESLRCPRTSASHCHRLARAARVGLAAIGEVSIRGPLTVSWSRGTRADVRFREGIEAVTLSGLTGLTPQPPKIRRMAVTSA